MATPASDNAEVIALYNQTYEHGSKIKDKETPVKAGFCIMGVGEKSVMSTDDISIEFRQEPYDFGDTNSGNSQYRIFRRFHVQVYNKTDRTIYVDLGNTFRVPNLCDFKKWCQMRKQKTFLRK